VYANMEVGHTAVRWNKRKLIIIRPTELIILLNTILKSSSAFFFPPPLESLEESSKALLYSLLALSLSLALIFIC